MEGLQYSEIPMLAGSNPALMQQALSAVRNDHFAGAAVRNGRRCCRWRTIISRNAPEPVLRAERQYGRSDGYAGLRD